MPPLATWREMIDGTLDLVDVMQMHSVLDEIEYQRSKADG